MGSLKLRLLGLWSLSLLASLAVGALLLDLQRQTEQAQVGRAAALVANGCNLIRDRVRFYFATLPPTASIPVDATLRRDLTDAVAVALSRQPAVEGGIWLAGTGPLAYAFPTYEGAGPKTDLPAAERLRIAAINDEAAREDQTVAARFPARSQTLLLQACALPGPLPSLTGWTMTRVRATAGLAPLRLGLALLFALMLVMAIALGRTLLVWSRHLGAIERALVRTGPDLPGLPRTGERELDRIVGALNDAGRRLADARATAAALAGRLAAAERQASLARLTAGVAHEIRNPIAAARLQGENALAGDQSRHAPAIADMLAQLDRLDALATELLTMTSRPEPHPRPTQLREFLDHALDRHRAAAELARIALVREAPDATLAIDHAIVGRILDNLLANAIRHTPPGGRVTITADPDRITVADTGPGVLPALRDRLFEPFVTSRPDGTGLGLAIARELAASHGAELRLEAGEGATFTLAFAPAPPSLRLDNVADLNYQQPQ